MQKTTKINCLLGAFLLGLVATTTCTAGDVQIELIDQGTRYGTVVGGTVSDDEGERDENPLVTKYWPASPWPMSPLSGLLGGGATQLVTTSIANSQGVHKAVSFATAGAELREYSSTMWHKSVVEIENKIDIRGGTPPTTTAIAESGAASGSWRFFEIVGDYPNAVVNTTLSVYATQNTQNGGPNPSYNHNARLESWIADHYLIAQYDPGLGSSGGWSISVKVKLPNQQWWMYGAISYTDNLDYQVDTYYKPGSMGWILTETNCGGDLDPLSGGWKAQQIVTTTGASQGASGGYPKIIQEVTLEAQLDIESVTD